MGTGALLPGGPLALILGIIGAFFGGMLLIASTATRFVAGQQEIHLAAVMAQMEDDRGYPEDGADENLAAARRTQTP
jgi:hypothetical protein